MKKLCFLWHGAYGFSSFLRIFVVAKKRKASSTILTILLQKLLKQTYIVRQTGCAAKSLVEQQFGKTANSDRSRLDTISEERVELTLFVLDPQNHEIVFQKSDNLSEMQDIQDAALMEIFAGHLRSTKGI